VEEGVGRLLFDWPVPVDLYELQSDLPAELLGVTNKVGPDGSHVDFKVAEGIVPRFYATSSRQFIIDIDIAKEGGIAAAIVADEAAKRQAAEVEASLRQAAVTARAIAEPGNGRGLRPGRAITPLVSTFGSTVRLSFPFEQDTAAAVFRRGDSVWMLFDTSTEIARPMRSRALDSIASGITVVPAGATKVVRLDLTSERLATLGSEGRSWVLSIGDVLLNPTEPLALDRVRDNEGQYTMTAELERPGTVHQFRDPVVGDVLSVVTAFPPARGIARNLQYVDFEALHSIHGLVVRADNPSLRVAIEEEQVVIGADEGLTLSAATSLRDLDSGHAAEFRDGYIDLVSGREADAGAFARRNSAIITRAAESEGRLRDVARFELAQFYLANRFAPEAIGVLEVLGSELHSTDLEQKVRLARGIADTLAARPADALAILGAAEFAEQSDALMWRSMARAAVQDYAGAHLDATAAEGVLEAYPAWVQTQFLLSGARAAVETRDYRMALRYIGEVAFAQLDPEQVTRYQLLQGRIAESEQRFDAALDIYGQVIAAGIPPTRAEGVFRTLALLDRTGRIDVAKATETLAMETMMWRGDWLEAEMQALLADLYFRSADYRQGFETVKQAAARFPDSPSVTGLIGEAQEMFADLYLNGRADELAPVAALSLYYDYQQLTPAGSRGDEMIRNLARRLVKMDLLTQAADLLEYQVDNRLKGAAQAQIATELAVIRIADRNPEAALAVLTRTRLAELPPQLQRQRRVLEARALLDAGREELAVDLLSRLEGRDVDLLRVDGLWKLQRYGEAAELLERVYSPGEATPPMTRDARMNIVKAAAGFVMAGDRLGLSRLRSKFGGPMSRSAEWAMFDFVTGDTTPTSVEFRRVAREISGLDTLNAFLDSYRATYAADAALTPEQPADAA
jgi:hypothetical protein